VIRKWGPVEVVVAVVVVEIVVAELCLRAFEFVEVVVAGVDSLVFVY
jgi:hypothetical protein